MMFFEKAAFVHREEAFLTLSSDRLLVLKKTSCIAAAIKSYSKRDREV